MSAVVSGDCISRIVHVVSYVRILSDPNSDVVLSDIFVVLSYIYVR
jgi:hypothetical protein